MEACDYSGTLPNDSSHTFGDGSRMAGISRVGKHLPLAWHVVGVDLLEFGDWIHYESVTAWERGLGERRLGICDNRV